MTDIVAELRPPSLSGGARGASISSARRPASLSTATRNTLRRRQWPISR